MKDRCMLSPDAVAISARQSALPVLPVCIEPGIYEHKLRPYRPKINSAWRSVAKVKTRVWLLLTGWRIDIMSVTEVAKALEKQRRSPAATWQKGTVTMARVEELLQMKSEGRVLNMDDSTLIARFVDRVERRGEADRKEEVDAHLAELKEIRDGIDQRALKSAFITFLVL